LNVKNKIERYINYIKINYIINIMTENYEQKKNVQTNKHHTDAIYRCRILECNYNHYIVKLATITKNNGDKKTLFIPNRNIYVKKYMIKEDVDVGDYINLTLVLSGQRTNVTKVLNIEKTIKFVKKINKKINTD